MVIVAPLRKMATYIPCTNVIDGPELARMVDEHAISIRTIPASITTDHGNEFSSGCWVIVCSHLSCNRRLSTALHRDMDNQTAWENHSMDEYIRACFNYQQDIWEALSPLVEFAYTNSIHDSTLITHWWENFNHHPTMQFKAPMYRSFRKPLHVDWWMAGGEENR